eukprot:TRINITY_DN15491_c0_g1_i1.p1 TRINITY_DN15491_c0_g1~~TRINITY_DN15491_c0_g1_i1.p1  ORF type:complete len:156 (-),score=35.41 TRINITY_DN15491_c0_g1_i1:67-534(-)
MPLLISGDAFLEGGEEKVVSFEFADLSLLPDQISDLSKIGVNRKGVAVKLRSILDKAGIALNDGLERAKYLKLISSDGMSISIPHSEVADSGVVAYQTEEHAPLPASEGGPFRFFVGKAVECKSKGESQVDQCANVKYLVEIKITSTKQPDTHKH